VNDSQSGSAGDLKQWQRRVFWSVWITYFAYYLCRYNIQADTPTENIEALFGAYRTMGQYD